VTDEKTAAAEKKPAAGDVYLANLEAAAKALRHLILTLEGAPGISPYTAAAVTEGKKTLAVLDEA
jgi:hypothetical protein